MIKSTTIGKAKAASKPKGAATWHGSYEQGNGWNNSGWTSWYATDKARPLAANTEVIKPKGKAPRPPPPTVPRPKQNYSGLRPVPVAPKAQMGRFGQKACPCGKIRETRYFLDFDSKMTYCGTCWDPKAGAGAMGFMLTLEQMKARGVVVNV